MKRYLITIAFSLIIILLYQVIEINFFSFGLNTKISNRLFTVFSDNPAVDESILICNIGTLNVEQIKTKVDSLLRFKPKIIGINGCHLNESDKKAIGILFKNRDVVINSCQAKADNSSGILVSEDNSVTHFNSVNLSGFEIVLANGQDILRNRGNKSERIYFQSPFKHYYQFELKDVDSSHPENFQDKIVLIGYLGSYVTEEIYDYQNCRITPMNEDFGEANIPPDMYDIQISANIISTINESRFINEINPIVRVGLMILFCLLNVGLISLAQTRWLSLNLMLSLFVFIGLIFLSSYLIVYFFAQYYFLELKELTTLLIISTLFAVYSNIKDRKSIKASV
jgi:hypothetical protein